MRNYQLKANAIRFLSVDAVEKAQSGHPGMPLGMADIATVLWSTHLKHNPKNPLWFNRDRFVLSNGHGSMLLYALLHLTGYGVTIEDLKQFRQLHSKTPGHPEYRETPGVETTTGPLGQGLANAVGMALSEKLLALEFNDETHQLVDHYTYAFVGDGCLMEGISHEACSLASTLKLNKLIVFYDSNGISIDGDVANWFTDDTEKRFNAYHWHVIANVDGHDFKAIEKAITACKNISDKPSLIICKTKIGFGSTFEGSEKSHGAPLGTAAIETLRKALDWEAEPFIISDEIYQLWDNKTLGIQNENDWLAQCMHYKAKYPEKYDEFLRRINGDLSDTWSQLFDDFIHRCVDEQKNIATRKASQRCIEQLSNQLPELLGGSADLSGSNNTNWGTSKALTHDNKLGNYIHYGVREFAMAAIMNGIALHGGHIPFGGTFLVFSDYARNAIRLSALMKKRVIYVLTHDSIGLGEDGPTHQPIEHAAMLRLTPNVTVWRPACLSETAVAWKSAIVNHLGPTCLLLSRQSLPPAITQINQAVMAERGGYILKDSEKPIQAIIIATGSEVSIALAAYDELACDEIPVRVVSMPCVEVFLQQDSAYQENVLPANIKHRIAIEASAQDYWYRFVGLEGKVLGLNQFGVSAPIDKAYEYLGLTKDTLVETVKSMLNH